MNLKKIHPQLAEALQMHGLETPNQAQALSFGPLKAGKDAVIEMDSRAGKTTTIVYTLLQKLEKAVGESTRALVIVENKEAVLEMVALFQKLGSYTNLRVFGTHEKGDMDYDKNQISLGNDIIIGTPSKINDLFSTAGFNLTTCKIIVVDDADVLFRVRHDAVIMRLSMSIEKTQWIFFTTEIIERVALLAEKIMIEPIWIEIEAE